MNGKQRYRCKSCGFNFTTGFRGKPIELRQRALQLYLDGLGFRAIGRILEVSNVTVLNWVRAYGLRSRPGQQKPVLAVKASEGPQVTTPLEAGLKPGAPVSGKNTSPGK